MTRIKRKSVIPATTTTAFENIKKQKEIGNLRNLKNQILEGAKMKVNTPKKKY